MGLGFPQSEGLRQQFVGAMARRRIVSPCDYDWLVEFEQPGLAQGDPLP